MKLLLLFGLLFALPDARADESALKADVEKIEATIGDQAATVKAEAAKIEQWLKDHAPRLHLPDAHKWCHFDGKGKNKVLHCSKATPDTQKQ